MSQQVTYDVDFKDGDLIVETLKALGYNPVVHNEAVSLKTYGRTGEKAHIVVGKEQGFSFGDLGFEKVKDGYKLHADHIDINKIGLAKIKQNYTAAFLKKRLKVYGTKFVLKSQEVNKKGNIELTINDNSN